MFVKDVLDVRFGVCFGVSWLLLKVLFLVWVMGGIKLFIEFIDVEGDRVLFVFWGIWREC